MATAIGTKTLQFTATQKWRVPRGVRQVWVEGAGGGGSGANGRATGSGGNVAGGGGGGSYFPARLVDVSAFQGVELDVVVGAGGTVPTLTEGASGGDGGDSSLGFGSTILALFRGGKAASGATGGAGGGLGGKGGDGGGSGLSGGTGGEVVIDPIRVGGAGGSPSSSTAGGGGGGAGYAGNGAPGGNANATGNFAFWAGAGGGGAGSGNLNTFYQGSPGAGGIVKITFVDPGL